MCTLNMTFEVPDSRAIDIEALKSQLNDLFHVIVSRPSVLKKDKPSEELIKETVEVKEHSVWVKSMAKYRRLEPIDCKQELLDSLDERFK